jgi:TolB-like protein/Tfp pilus assembly protein PilF
MAVPPSADRTQPPSLFKRRIPPRWAVFSAAVLSLLGGSLWLRVTAQGSGEPVRAAVRANSMAILSFTNASPDSAENYLGRGVAGELTRLLNDLPGLRVAPRSSAFAVQRGNGDPRVIGRRLNVGAVLQGSIRRSGERLRVNAHLVDVDDGFDLWSETYERTTADLLAIQDEITSAVAGTLRIPSAGDATALPNHATDNLAAYDAYLAGTYLLERFTPGTTPRAINYLSRAVRLDTSFALAYVALAGAYLRRGGVESEPPLVAMPLAKEAAARALELDSTLAEAHITLGNIQFGYDRNWRNAEVEFRRAIALEPSSPDAYHAYSHYLLAMGRIDEAREAAERAMQLSPLAPELIRHVGWHYLHVRDYGRAREALWRAIDLDPSAWRPHLDLALVEQVDGNYSAAESHLRTPLRVAPQRAEIQVALGQVYALSGRADSARTILRRLLDDSEQRYISPYLIGALQGSLGQRTQAFASLNRAVKERSDLVAYLRIDPRVDSLRADRRFPQLLRQLRLP